MDVDCMTFAEFLEKKMQEVEDDYKDDFDVNNDVQDLSFVSIDPEDGTLDQWRQILDLVKQNISQTHHDIFEIEIIGFGFGYNLSMLNVLFDSAYEGIYTHKVGKYNHNYVAIPIKNSSMLAILRFIFNTHPEYFGL